MKKNNLYFVRILLSHEESFSLDKKRSVIHNGNVLSISSAKIIKDFLVKNGFFQEVL